jgi:hypothetical protein
MLESLGNLLQQPSVVVQLLAFVTVLSGYLVYRHKTRADTGKVEADTGKSLTERFEKLTALVEKGFEQQRDLNERLRRKDDENSNLNRDKCVLEAEKINLLEMIERMKARLNEKDELIKENNSTNSEMVRNLTNRLANEYWYKEQRIEVDKSTAQIMEQFNNTIANLTEEKKELRAKLEEAHFRIIEHLKTDETANR